MAGKRGMKKPLLDLSPVIEEIGIKGVVEQMGLKRVINEVGLKQFIREAGRSQVIDELVADLPPAEQAELRHRLK